MVAPRSGGEPREVDVLIETSIGQHKLSIGLECRDHSRKETIEWIDALHGRYADLPINRVVAVSRKGFTAGARLQAKKFGIELLTLETATAADWPAHINRLKMGLISVHLQLMEFRLEYKSAIDSTVSISKTSLIEDVSGGPLSTVEADAQNLYKEHVVKDRKWIDQIIPELWAKGAGNRTRFDIPFIAKQRFVVADDGRRFELAAIVLVMEGHFSLDEGESAFHSYGDVRIITTAIQPSFTREQHNMSLLLNSDGSPKALNIRIQ